MHITAKIQPNSPARRVEVAGLNTLKVWVNSPPERGKANKEIINFLTRILRKQLERNPGVHLIQGATTRSKILEVDCTWDEITSAIKAHRK